MKMETFGNVVINPDTALQYLLGETEIKTEDGIYVLDIEDEAEEIVVTVDYERTAAYDGENHPIGKSCVFNVTYSTDTYSRNPFSFGELINDLHDQHLEEVETWLYEAVLKYGGTDN
ncbi:hypothetical protein E2R60_04930 [Paenibacillus dendritiformis]|uniref:hypothetical protein n=1 Tax=Paenibacillus dendritiformis TaxID=130049 RepID=UPI00105934DB|nr:hypothetical protein [Paenibacillus dendritiformis]TDL57827.1 hypothetical protein E2R60_04930 [Paenibacillus dendritiformis]